MRLFLLLIVALILEPCVAQNNQLFGISRNSNPNVTYLATVDATNGTINDVSSNSYAIGVANFSFTVDPILEIYYFTDPTSIIGIDLVTGNLVHQNTIITNQGSIFQNFIYNEVTQEIIGIERGGGLNSGVYLSKIDPTTGVVTTISPSPFANTSAITVAGNALNLRQQWYHIFSQDRILSIDVNTGLVVHNPLFDTTDYAYFNNLFFNPVNQKLYAIGRNSNPAELFLTQIDPVTGLVTTISPTSLGTAIELEGSALDPVNGIYYFKRYDTVNGTGTTLVGVDIYTGLEVSSTSFDFSQSNGAFYGHFYFGGPTVQLLSNEDVTEPSNITIYPNPTSDILQVNGESISRVQVLSLTGQIVLEESYQSQDAIEIDASEFSKGVYFLKAYDVNRTGTTLKFVKN